MTYKQIEATREARLWITQIVVPIATTAIAAGIAVPEVRDAVVAKCGDVKKSISKMLKRKEKAEEIKANENFDNVVIVRNDVTGEYRMRRIK